MRRQSGCKILDQDKRGAQINRDMRIPALARRRLDRIVSEYRGVVDQAADRPELALGARQQRRNGTLIGEIGGERDRRAAFAADQLGQILSGVARAVIMNRDSETILGERKRERTADPLCAAGY
jgi:hypothetical protein